MRRLAAIGQVSGIIVCVGVCGCGVQPATSTASAAADRSGLGAAASSANSKNSDEGSGEATRGAGLREAIVGKWIEIGMSDNPETLEFSADGKYSRWATSTPYRGTYRV